MIDYDKSIYLLVMLQEMIFLKYIIILYNPQLLIHYQCFICSIPLLGDYHQ